MGDDNSTTDVTLDQVLNIKGGKSENDGLTNNNIGVVKDSNNGLKVKLAKDLTGLTSVSAATKITVGNGNPNAELQSDNLTFTQTTGANSGKTIYGHDGVKFTDNPNAGTAAAGTTRITRNRIGFAQDGDGVDTSKPYLDKDKLQVGEVKITKDGINAGGKEITNVKSAITYTKNSGQQDFVDRLTTAHNNKANSAATIKDLYNLSQVSLTFEGDINKATRKLGETLKVKGGADTSELTDKNIGVVASDDGLTANLAKNLSGLEAVNLQKLPAAPKVKVGSNGA
ncbi:adhesin, partial [Moraxella catarrhalis]|nr:adhesin [Moraxella catarrhalis]